MQSVYIYIYSVYIEYTHFIYSVYTLYRYTTCILYMYTSHDTPDTFPDTLGRCTRYVYTMCIRSICIQCVYSTCSHKYHRRLNTYSDTLDVFTQHVYTVCTHDMYIHTYLHTPDLTHQILDIYVHISRYISHIECTCYVLYIQIEYTYCIYTSSIPI